ncbi:MAG: hypothetical protein DRP42_06205 [Tenericutes bacterium]|nr:MAG: hypothetical protein DRP42_06205 [Mycoplasmatota bacterium]
MSKPNKNELLPKYSDNLIPCIKCGEIREPFAQYKLAYFTSSGTDNSDERLRRECINCGYNWEERPMDWTGETL